MRADRVVTFARFRSWDLWDGIRVHRTLVLEDGCEPQELRPNDAPEEHAARAFEAATRHIPERLLPLPALPGAERQISRRGKWARIEHRRRARERAE